MRRAARASAAVSGIALVVVLSLDWFAPARGVLIVGTDDGRISGWTGLSPFSVAFLVVAAIATVAGRGIVAVAVCTIALAILLTDLLTLDDAVALRWPAYAGIALAADLLVSATWAWRASHLESPVG
ncbi:hypothetical protein [Baekduia sp. Peel2402]|uniref:hypothetical protein n=1 Tax=Baekduia sp. Peel2402 TaxID=3458296 RepID=UPI00403ED1B1